MQAKPRAPVHLWIVAVLSFLWNAMGAFDYSATQLRLEFYMSQFSDEQLAYFYGFPAWADAAWAIAVWASLLGSLGLLLRKAWAVVMFAVAILGMITNSIYTLVLSDGLELMGTGAAGFTVVIWLIAFGLLLYAVAMKRRSLLV
jgi:hypothetical protein